MKYETLQNELKLLKDVSIEMYCEKKDLIPILENVRALKDDLN